MRCFAAALLCTVLVMLLGDAVTAQEQYIVVNIAPGEDFQAVFEQIRQIAGTGSAGHIGLGVGGIFSYLHKPRDDIRNELAEFLSLADRYNVPIVVQLDGEQWGGARHHLKRDDFVSIYLRKGPS